MAWGSSGFTLFFAILGCKTLRKHLLFTYNPSLQSQTRRLTSTYKALVALTSEFYMSLIASGLTTEQGAAEDIHKDARTYSSDLSGETLAVNVTGTRS